MRDVYLQPDAPDPVLDDVTALALVGRHVRGAHAVSGVDESGGEARTYVVAAAEGDVILKTQRPHRLRPRTSLEKETCFLRHLATAYAGEPLPVPRIFGYGKEGLLEYICMSRVPGVAVERTTLSGTRRRATLHALGQLLARAHAVPQGPLRASGLFPGDRTGEDVRARIEGTLSAAVEALQRQPAPWPGASLDEIAGRVRGVLPQLSVAADQLVALHANPGPMHTFVVSPAPPVPMVAGAVEVEQRFSGLIDFGDAYVSHPAFDLVRWPDAEDRAALFEGYTAARGPALVNAAFIRLWRVASILADLQLAARRPERMPALAGQVERTLAALV